MRATTIALICSIAILVTSLASAVFATTLAANALAGLPRTTGTSSVQLAANGAPGFDLKSPVVR